MVLGPLGSDCSAREPRWTRTEDLFAEVRRIAEQLVRTLEQAANLSGQWADRRLTEALVDAAMSESLAGLARTGVWGEANRLPSDELWRIAGSLLELGTLQSHARLKPRGYAGDYQMLTAICEDSCCEHPLGRAFDLYFQRQAAPQAVRARTQQTAAALASHCLGSPRADYHVVSVGCGPAIDVASALAILPAEQRCRVRVTLLDLDPEGLEVAERRVRAHLAADAVRSVRTNLYRLAQNSPAGEELGEVDFLICSGLFDYLADEPAAALLELFWRRLGPGARLLVGNFAPHNPARAYMEWIGNWYLNYRTAAQMEQLVTGAGIPPEAFTIGCERTGVDLFLIAQRKAG